MREPPPLPPGQVEIEDFPRFGLMNFAFRFPAETERIEIAVGGDVERPARFAAELESLERVEQVSDFHCVTTWTRRGLRWGGWRFRDFYEQLVVPRVRPEADAALVVLRAQDGLAQSLPLEDALAPDVLLADRLDGERLGVDHGAPIRLVAPAHYGCKSVRHLNAVEFWRDARNYRFPGPRLLMNHPRARVMHEERGRVLPPWVFRALWPALIPPVRWLYGLGLRRHRRRETSRSTPSRTPGRTSPPASAGRHGARDHKARCALHDPSTGIPLGFHDATRSLGGSSCVRVLLLLSCVSPWPHWPDLHEVPPYLTRSISTRSTTAAWWA